MRRLVTPFLLFIFLTATYAQNDLPDLIAQVKPAVVSLTIYDSAQREIATATGFFIAHDTVVTNQHVIDEGQYVKVTTEAGDTYFAKEVTAESTRRDLAVLKLRAPIRSHAILELTTAEPRLGEKVFVVGNPQGFEWTISEGIVSGFRNFEELGPMIQITADISHGSSGSPVFNMQGKVIGMVEGAWKEGQRINFAIPAKSILQLTSSVTPVQPQSDYSYRSKVLFVEPSNTQRWVNTGLFVFPGEIISISVVGQIAINRKTASDANGVAIIDKFKPLNDAATGSLIGTIGVSKPFYIGKKGAFRAEVGGFLMLGINMGDFTKVKGEYLVSIIAAQKKRKD